MLAVEYEPIITLGSAIIAAALALGGVGAMIFGVRYKVVADIEERRADALHKRLEEERALKHEALTENAALKLVRDTTPILERLVALEEQSETRYGLGLKQVTELFEQHERRAQDRHEKQVKVLEEMAATLESMNQRRRHDQGR